jgi:hypothetical protein
MRESESPSPAVQGERGGRFISRPLDTLGVITRCSHTTFTADTPLEVDGFFTPGGPRLPSPHVFVTPPTVAAPAGPFVSNSG